MESIQQHYNLESDLSDIGFKKNSFSLNVSTFKVPSAISRLSSLSKVHRLTSSCIRFKDNCFKVPISDILKTIYLMSSPCVPLIIYVLILLR